ncbi:MAG TPA: hypothetical protein VK204_17260, partial [Nocardioidaceae bacterium]|nr:hypothetical protein [Nocardioidaceae bacterium]
GEPVFLSHAQVEELAQACPGYELFVRVLAYTGMRWGEATAVRVRRLDLMKRRIEVVHTAVEINGEMTYGTPKTHRCRSVPVPRSLVDARGGPGGGSPLVPSPASKAPARTGAYARPQPGPCAGGAGAFTEYGNSSPGGYPRWQSALGERPPRSAPDPIEVIRGG